MTTNGTKTESRYVYRILRYVSDLVRNEWVNIGVLLMDPATGRLRLRLVEEQEEFARIRRLHPAAEEHTLRSFRDHLEDRFAKFLKESEHAGSSLSTGEELLKLVEKWDDSLSNVIQLAPQCAVYALDMETEAERLYAEHVALQRRDFHVGAPGSRAQLRGYCSQVWREAKLWNHLEKAIRVTDYTFPGDPMRIDYCYARNGTRGFVQTLSVSRAPADCKLFAYTAARIAARAPFRSEFAAVTDLELRKENDRHRFVHETLRDAGIESVPLDHFAVWVGKLKPTMH